MYCGLPLRLALLIALAGALTSAGAEDRSWKHLGHGGSAARAAILETESQEAALGNLVATGSPLVPDNEIGDSEFGQSVALSADGATAVVGGPSWKHSEGRAWILVRSGSKWALQTVLVPTDVTPPSGPFSHTNFGRRVAISADGGTALVSGPGDHDTKGAVWVFTRSGTSWIQQGAKLVPAEAEPNGLFGAHLALSADGDTALIAGDYSGTWIFARSSSTWTQQGLLLDAANQPVTTVTTSAIALAPDGGTAFVGTGSTVRAFVRSGTSWSEQGPPLTPNDVSSYPAVGFGTTIAASSDGNIVLIGNPEHTYYTTDGVWLFRRSGPTWEQQGSRLPPPAGVNEFAATLALSPDATRALVGAQREDNAGSAIQTYELQADGGLQATGVLTLADNSPPLGGQSLALSAAGDTAIVGAENPVSPAEGGLWTFTKTDEGWTQLGSKLTEPYASGDSAFGTSVALSADANTALVGAPNDGGLGGNSPFGAVWVYTRSGSRLVQSTKLPGTGGLFGRSIALASDGQTALVGEYSRSVTALTRAGGKWNRQELPRPVEFGSDGLYGDTDFGAAVALSADGSVAVVGAPRADDWSGAVWVYTRSGAVWTQEGPKLTGTGLTDGYLGGSRAGMSVALSSDGTTALIGGMGGVWPFVRTGSSWSQQGPKLATGDRFFGSSLALSAAGDTAIIGAADKTGPSTGTAWVYERTGGTWSPQGSLSPNDEGGSGSFGDSVAVSADGATALVGGMYAGSPLADPFAGAAWLFKRVGGTWVQQGPKLGVAPLQSHLGASVALSAGATTALVGAPAYSAAAGDFTGAAWMLTESGPLPATPTQVAAVAGSSRATVSFVAPEPVVGSPITSYTVYAAPGGQTAAGSASPITVSQLVAGTSYTFTVTATNGAGEGPASAPSNPVTPLGAPGAPTGAAAIAGDGYATVSFTPPETDGGFPILYYTATASPGGQSASSTSSPITVPGLQTDVSYTFTVTATNSAGTGPPSAPSNSVAPVASPPRAHPDPPAETPRPTTPEPPPPGPRPPLPPH